MEETQGGHQQGQKLPSIQLWKGSKNTHYILQQMLRVTWQELFQLTTEAVLHLAAG